jgi:glutamate-1-semialdehyde 2,1-aminomutase
MRLFDGPAVARLNELGARVRARLSEAIAVAGVPACVTGGGSLFRVHMKAQPPRDYRSAFEGPEEAARRAVVVDHLFAHGILLINTCTGALSTPMTENEIDRLADVMFDGLRAAARVEPPAAGGGRRQEPA